MSDTGSASAAPTARFGAEAEILDAVADVIIVLDADARLAWGNRAAEDFFGHSVEESIGTSAMAFIHPRDAQLVRLSFESMQHKDVGSLLEVRLLSAEGWRLVEVLGSRHGDGIVLSVRDITRRRRWEVTSDEVERSRSLMQNSTTLTFLLGRDGTVMSSSGAITRHLGLSQGRIEGLRFAAIVDGDDVHSLDDALSSVVCSTAGSVTRDLRMLTADGTTIPYAMTFTNLVDDPTVEGILVTGHDVSDRVRTEEALRDAVSVLAATLESTADAVVVVSSDGSISSCNRRFGEMWGIDSDTVVAMRGRDLQAAIMSQVVEPDMLRAVLDSVRTDHEFETHGTMELSDGRVIEGDSLPQYVHGAVVGRVWTFRDVTEERRLRDELAHQAFHDSLTGLANQALLHDRLHNAVARTERSGGELAVLYIDLDGFKRVNDRLGHHIGDELLIGISRRIEACLRAGDTASRLGGDEFAVLLDDLTDRRDARTVAERIIASLRVPTMTSAGEIAVAASIGIAYGRQGGSVDDVLRKADLAMYDAKASGGDASREFSPELLRAGTDRFGPGVDVVELIDRGELDLVYQPIFDMPRGKVLAMEALLRWRHPTRGLLPPSEFLSGSSHMIEVDRFVLERACSDAVRWGSHDEHSDVAVCVNISAEHLAEPGLAPLVHDTLAASGLWSSHLVLDIAEGAVMADPDAARRQFEALGALGVKVAMDDFGTGATSLAHLAELPIAMLKIDRSFLQATLREHRLTAVQAVLMVTESLGVLPVAEGVETQGQVDALLQLGCHTMQGFHLARPIESDAVIDFLDAAAPARLRAVGSGR